MSTNRKRKHRNPARHHNSRSFSKPQSHVEPFLSHHEAYLNQHPSSSSSSWGFDQPSAYHQAISHGESSSSRQPEPNPLQALYIQAHEAHIVRGLSAKIAAESLEVVEYHVVPLPPGTAAPESGTIAPVVVTPKTGSALIKCGDGGGGGSIQSGGRSPSVTGGDIHSGLVVVDDDTDYGNSSAAMTEQASAPIWVDRYDIRLLLDNPRPFSILSSRTTALPPASPTGFSDLPSDAEDTFFFSPTEAEEFKREKRQRIMERARDERVKARLQEEESNNENDKEEEDVWGGSDEEPDPIQKELMNRTATHLASSPNAAQLEMRILANYGADKRFAFLRGRWKHAWGLAKAKARIELGKKEEEKTKKATPVGVLALAGYGSDSEDDGDDDEGKGPPGLQADMVDGVDDGAPSTFIGSRPSSHRLPDSSPPADANIHGSGSAQHRDTNAEEQAKEARRQRLKAWAEKRRAGVSI